MASTLRLRDLAMRMGDSDLVLAQQLIQWCGHAPVLEEELALSNVALDLLGQARLWLGVAGALDPDHPSEDALAFERDAEQWRHIALVEAPNGDYAQTLVRQFFFDHYHQIVLDALAASDDAQFSAIAVKSRKEVAYHVRRSDDLVIRLGDGSHESRRRMQSGIDRLWPCCGDLFTDTMGGLLDAALGDGAAAQRAGERFRTVVEEVLREATLSLPVPVADGNMRPDRAHFVTVLAEMQSLHRAHPGATW